MISIELISRGEKSLENTLSSITRQSFHDYEIVCADSSNDDQIIGLLQMYNCKVIILPKNTPHLKARYEAHIHSTGEFSLLLDSTRPLNPDALSLLFNNYKKYDMVIMKEDSQGNGFWVNQARLLNDISLSQFYRSSNESIAFLLPRFYRSVLLTDAFNSITLNAGNLFNKISYGEHHIIFDECRKLSKNIGLTNEILISHYEDDSLRRIISKYYRYGKSQKTLKKLKNSSATNLSTHMRRNIGIKKRMKIMPITIARGVPFALGYVFGGKHASIMKIH